MPELFDTRPKDNPRFLYGRKEELRDFTSQLSDGKWVAVLGPRRIGKTSVVLCGLHLLGRDYIPVMIDFRAFAASKVIPLSTFANALAEAFNQTARENKRLTEMLKDAFEGVEEFEVEVPKIFRIRIKKRPKAKTFQGTLSSILDKINSECKKRKLRVVLAFDEAQEIRKVAGVNTSAVLAHVYDYCANILPIFTGSQFGLLREVLDPRPEDPLYGRYVHRIPLKKFDFEQSMEFLKLGLSQRGVLVGEPHLKAAVDVIDGIPGWLTDFGTRLVGLKKVAPSKAGVERVLKETVDAGKRLTLQELNNFLKGREARRKYLTILKHMAARSASWAELKRALELKFGPVADKNFTDLLGSLSDFGFVEKVEGRYKIVDPLLIEALRV